MNVGGMELVLELSVMNAEGVGVGRDLFAHQTFELVLRSKRIKKHSTKKKIKSMYSGNMSVI